MPTHNPRIIGGLFLTLSLNAPGHAASILFTDEATFLAALAPGYYLEDFPGLTYGGFVGPSMSFGPTNGFSYTFIAPPNGIWTTDSAMSTNYPYDPLVATFTGNPVTALGGFFYGSDFHGNYLGQPLTVALSDGTTHTYTPPNATTFLGFLSDVPLSWIGWVGVQGPGNNWPAVDHFYVGSAATPAAVPEPSTLGGTLLLGVIGLALRRRGRQSAPLALETSETCGS